MNAIRVAERVVVSDERDDQVASQVGLHLLAAVSDRSGLTTAYSSAVRIEGRARRHDPGRLAAQVAVMLAGGGECVADMSALRDQPDLFGEVASGPTIWRVISSIDEATLAELRAARARAREWVWATGGGPSEVVLDVDATLVEIHSENKEQATSHYKRGFGFHPMLCYLDETGEALSGILRPGNATANSAADQLLVVDMAIDQLPEEHQRGHRDGDAKGLVRHDILVRTDTAGAVHDFVHGLVERNLLFSVGARVNDAFCQAISAVPKKKWVPAVDVEGDPRDGAFIAEVKLDLSTWPQGTRAICRREKPHPGAQLRLWDTDGWRHQVVLTNQQGDPVALEAIHRAHADVENRVKAAKSCGLERMPFTAFSANAAWVELCLAACDLLAWLKVLCLDGELRKAEPKRLRYRLLHVAARIIRSARRVFLRLPRHWPWADDLAGAYRRLAALGP